MNQNFQQGISPSAEQYYLKNNSEFYPAIPGIYCPPAPQVNPNSHPQYCDLHPTEPPNHMEQTGEDEWSSHGNSYCNQNYIPSSKYQQMPHHNLSLAHQTNSQFQVSNQNDRSIFAGNTGGTNPYSHESKIFNPETEVTTGTDNFKNLGGKCCEKIKVASEDENERTVKTFMGFVTSLDGDLGYVDKEVLFHASAVKGLVKAKKDDYVLVKAESVQCLPPIKWNAKIVQVLDKSFCPDNTKLQISPEQPIPFQNGSSKNTSKSSRTQSDDNAKHSRPKLPAKMKSQSSSSSKSSEIKSNGQKRKSGDDRGSSDRSGKTSGKDLTSSSNQLESSRNRSSEKRTNECSNEKSEKSDTKRTKLQGNNNSSLPSSSTTPRTGEVSDNEPVPNKVITGTQRIIRTGHNKLIQILGDIPEKSSDGQSCNSMKSAESTMDKNIDLTTRISDATETRKETANFPEIQKTLKQMPHVAKSANCNGDNLAASNNIHEHLEISDNIKQNVSKTTIKHPNSIPIVLKASRIKSKNTDIQNGNVSEKVSKKPNAIISPVGNKNFDQESAGKKTIKIAENLAPIIPVTQLTETTNNIGKEKLTKKLGNRTMVANAEILIRKPVEDVNSVQNPGSPEKIPLGSITIKKEKPDENIDKSIGKCVTTTELPILVSKIKSEKCDQKSAERMTIKSVKNVSPIKSVSPPTETHNHIGNEKPSDKLAFDNQTISHNTVMAQKHLQREINHVRNSGSDSPECEKIPLGSIKIHKEKVDESRAKSIVTIPKLPTTVFNIKIKKDFRISTEEIRIKSTENLASTECLDENGQNSMDLSNAEISDNEIIRSDISRVEHSVTDSKNDTHPTPNLKCTEVNKDIHKNSETKNATNTAGAKPPYVVLNKNDSNAKQNGQKLKTQEQVAKMNSNTAHLNAAQLKLRNAHIRMIDIRMDRQCDRPNSSFGCDPTNVQYRMDRRQFGEFDNSETFFSFENDFANHHPRDNGMLLLPTPSQHFMPMSDDRYEFRGPSCHVCFKDGHHGSVCWLNSGNGCRCCGKRSHSQFVCWHRHEKCKSCGRKGHRANMCRI